MREEPNMEDEREKSKAINHKIVDLQILQIFGFDGKLIKLRKKGVTKFYFSLKEKYRLKFTQIKNI